ncbi:MAG: prolipoprotein diacylglyceryl transferase family protein, partial [Pseudomonadota bacterium]|nr:prolipoprotein diacylglyceryl transferase family protein [Pseudomonadota bacterium]
LLLFLVLFWFTSKPRPRMAAGGLFLLLYGSFRFIVEFVREPDSHIGFDMLGWMTRGQLLSLPMIVAGLGFLVWAYRRNIIEPEYEQKPADSASKASKKKRKQQVGKS